MDDDLAKQLEGLKLTEIPKLKCQNSDCFVCVESHSFLKTDTGYSFFRQPGIFFDEYDKLEVSISGLNIENLPKPIRSFEDIKELPSSILNSISYKKPTPVQKNTIPIMIEGLDLVVCAQTGSGKTGAFLIPILAKISLKPKIQKPYVLILTPTRELAIQIHRDALELTKRTHIADESFGTSANNELQKEIVKIYNTKECECNGLKEMTEKECDLNEIECDWNEKRCNTLLLQKENSENVSVESYSEIPDSIPSRYSGSYFLTQNINNQCYISPLHLTKYLEYSEKIQPALERNLLSSMSSPVNSNEPEYYGNIVFSNFTFKNLCDLSSNLNFKKKNPCTAIALVDKKFLIAYNNEIETTHKKLIKKKLKTYKSIGIDNFEIIFLENKEKGHAEMKVLEYIEKYGFKNKCYIATSIETCPSCYISFEYFKNVEGYSILFRKSHNNLCIGDKWPVLSFMTKYDTLFDHLNNYLEEHIFPRIVTLNEEKYEIDEEKIIRHICEIYKNQLKNVADIRNKYNSSRSIQLHQGDGEDKIVSTRVSKRIFDDSVVQNPRQINNNALQTTWSY